MTVLSDPDSRPGFGRDAGKGVDDPGSVLVGLGVVVLDVAGHLVDTRAAHGCLRRQMRALNALAKSDRGYISGRDPEKAGSYAAGAFERLRIGMYILARGTQTLETVHSTRSAGEFIDLNTPDGALAAGIASCFRNRTLVAVHDTRRSPFSGKKILRVRLAPCCSSRCYRTASWWE